MELLLENVRNSIFNRGDKLPKAASKWLTSDVARVVTMIICTFLFGRAAVLYAIFPCSIAITTVLLNKGKANIYVVPLVLGGLLTHYGTGYEIWGDFVATLLCGILFFMLSGLKISLVVKAFVAVGVMVLTKSIYYFFAPLVFIYDVFMMCVEALFILALIYIFHIFVNLLDKESKVKTSVPEGIVAIAVTAVILVGGIGFSPLGFVAPAHLLALLTTLLIGHRMGIMEGGLSGIASGVAVMFMISGSPAIIGIFACAGMVAGFFQGLNRVVTGTCFAAVCLAFGLIKGYPELYISMYDPLLAALIFMLIPKKLIKKMELLFARIRRDQIYYELMAKDRMKKTLKGYLETFEKLSHLYGSNKNANAVISMQFKAMAKVVRGMTEELYAPVVPMMQPKNNYDIKVAVSSYAREGRVSGDSYICSALKDSEYMIALSDGMGKGQTAYDESALTITTLYNLIKAGFDVESALKTMNNLMMMKSDDEIFSTVDLGLFDRISGKIKLFKIGAAVTFIKRDGRVEMVRVSALPLGILDAVRLGHIELQTRKGDTIIIVSDGITDADRTDPQMEWLKEAIANIRSKDPQTMSDLLVNKAVERYGLREKDDMTVITALIN